jgi:NAD(P)H-hydrate epimerase
MKILSAEQIRKVDEYTISHEPIASIDLMERAAMACFRRLIKLSNPESSFHIYCGMGNNGGDGMAIGRLLIERGFNAKIFVIHSGKNFSNDAQRNYELLKTKFNEAVIDVQSADHLPQGKQNVTAIDAIFGSGLNKPAEGLAGKTIDFINDNYSLIISIDVPSGLFIDKSSVSNQSIIRSTLTFSLQLPKLAYMLPENKNYIRDFELVDIGLSEEGIESLATNNYYITKAYIKTLFKKRNKFDHKGTFGHALLLAGSRGKAGAAVISAGACLRSGAGLLTVRSTNDVTSALLQHFPEAMSERDDNENYISEIQNPEKFDAIGFGPGVGTEKDTEQALKKLLQYYSGRLVIDADGLNILSENKTWLEFLPPSTILTPHPKEFERLAGKSSDDFDRLQTLRNFSLKYRCIVVLKGAHSATAMPDGNIFFNSSGNPGLAKGGSGDALTGIILGLLARGYNAPQAAIIGAFVHGYSADLCHKKMSEESILATDLICMLPKAFKKLEN